MAFWNGCHGYENNEKIYAQLELYRSNRGIYYDPKVSFQLSDNVECYTHYDLLYPPLLVHAFKKAISDDAKWITNNERNADAEYIISLSQQKKNQNFSPDFT